jgi:hypothetical protein
MKQPVVKKRLTVVFGVRVVITLNLTGRKNTVQCKKTARILVIHCKAWRQPCGLGKRCRLHGLAVQGSLLWHYCLWIAGFKAVFVVEEIVVVGS